ncbi:MAG: hypothetical protein H5T86_08655, partial [Armatimonadetes bacterium]|nr:hypothetical protein [Armatimonadota bacterium]
MPRSLGLAHSVTLSLLVGGLLAGCARGGEGQQGIVPTQVMDIVVRYAGAVNDAFYYFIALDLDNDPNDGPIPVASGPYWGNGWGTGSMTHFVEYHQGQYQVFRVVLEPYLVRAGGGIVEVGGSPQITDAGRATIAIENVELGSASVSGAGMIQSVENLSCQNAGTLTISTDASGKVVAGSVQFTPAADGGRALTEEERAAVDSLNAGGMQLKGDSLAALGLRLQLGPPGAGNQAITIAPTVGRARVTYTTTSPPQRTDKWTATLRANSSTPTDSPPIAGMAIRTADLLSGQSAEVVLTPAQQGQ